MSSLNIFVYNNRTLDSVPCLNIYMFFAVVHLHIVINLARRSYSKAADVLHFTVSLTVALSNCQSHSVGEEDLVCQI